MRTDSRELLAVGIFGGRSRLGDRIETLLRRGRTYSPRASAGGVFASAGVLIGLLLAGCLAPRWIAFAQQTPEMKFDVASVKVNKSDAPPYLNFPLNSGDFYTPNGGLFSATNWPLITYLVFAYKLMGNQIAFPVPQLPSWVMNDRFDIQARADGNPTKDRMRLMMRSLLADRFKFAIHTDMREIPVLAFVLVKPGRTGPQLQPHPADAPCETSVSAPSRAAPVPDVLRQTVAGGFPAVCNGILGMPPSVPGRSRLGGRNVTIGFMADMFSQRVNPSRPMIDATGLFGTFDFLLEFTPELRDALPAASSAAPDPDGPTFEQALRDQLGIKMESSRSRMEVMVVDHIEHPSVN